MKKYILTSFSSLTLLFSSCEEVIDYELENADAKLVVEGLITDEPGPYEVRLSSTKGYLADGRTKGVNGALVIISDSEGTVDTLAEVGEGLYQTGNLLGKAGNTYFLQVMADGKEYTAQSYMPAVSAIDSLTFNFRNSGHMVDEGFYPSLHFADPVGRGNYYRWNVYVNGKLNPDELAVLSDDLHDGNYGHAAMGFALEKGDKLMVELFAIDRRAYDFWIALSNQQSSGGGPFETIPANAPSNISNGALGFFGASAVSKIEGKAE